MHTYGTGDVSIDQYGHKISEATKTDLRALPGIYGMAERYQVITFVTTEQTLDELYSKATGDQGISRFKWALELFNLWKYEITPHFDDEDFSDSTKLARTWLDYGVFDFLPDSQDRVLIASGMAAHCSIFLTMDYKTILAHRRRIKDLTGMEVLRPVQYWTRIRGS